MKPSKIKTIVAKKNKFLCPSGFSAIMLFGKIYSRDDKYIDTINATNGIDSTAENHEMVHVHQAVSTWNSWICFYFLYICQWLYNLPLIFVSSMAPYKFMPFELEAYKYEIDFDYNVVREKATEWKGFRNLKMKDRRRFAKMWYKEGYRRKMKFSEFVNRMFIL